MSGSKRSNLKSQTQVILKLKLYGYTVYGRTVATVVVSVNVRVRFGSDLGQIWVNVLVKVNAKVKVKVKVKA